VLVEEDARLELAQVVLKRLADAGGRGQRDAGRFIVRAGEGGRVHDLLGGDGDHLERIPGWRLLAHALDELGAAQIGEDHDLLHQQRCLGEARHGSVLVADLVADHLPAAGKAGGEVRLAADGHHHVLVGRLPLDHRGDRRLPVVVAREVFERVEVEVLILQRVHQLVRDGDPGDGVIVAALHHVQRLALGVVEPDDLFGEEVQVHPLEIHLIGEHPEALVGALLAGQLALDGRVPQLLLQVGADLLPRPDLDLRPGLEGQPHAPLNARDRVIRDAVVGASLVAPFAGSRREQRARERERAPRSHGSHRTLCPVATATTRAMS
jgi:hypothetical protein